jgi:hypothetical protein
VLSYFIGGSQNVISEVDFVVGIVEPVGESDITYILISDSGLRKNDERIKGGIGRELLYKIFYDI